jgi:hypothetical protein
MAFISTFELLLKPQLPKLITDKEPELSPLARNVLQGYFLTIANITNSLVSLSLVVTTRTPGLEDNKNILTILDATGGNKDKVEQKFDSGREIKKSRFTFSLDANDTALFILQPNALNKALREAANYELRGYAEIFVSSVSTSKTTQLIITPEHRGTFFGKDSGKEKSELGELAYAIPLANGKSLFELG